MGINFTSPLISFDDNSNKKGNQVLVDSQKRIKSAYDTLVDVNASLIAELQGDLKTAYIGASSTSEAGVKKLCGVFGLLNSTMEEYGTQMKNTNEEANVLVGGKSK